MSKKYNKFNITTHNEEHIPFEFFASSSLGELTPREVYDKTMEIENTLRYPTVQRAFRMYLLHEDETIQKDITPYVLTNGSLSKKYQQGQTRTMSITLINSDNIWNPSDIKGYLFANSKFKLQIGVLIGDKFYYVDEGIYVCQNPEISNSDANKTVSIELCDKFALLDGTITGTTENDMEIPLGTNVWQAVRALLRLPKDNLGNPYDSKRIIFPMKYANEKLPYTIQKTANNNIGEIITDIADCFSCDVYYNEIGELTFRENLDNIDYHNRKLSWVYKDIDYETNSVVRKDDWSKIKNRFIVKGTNINGAQCKGIAENTNPNSPYNVNGYFGIRPNIIEDSLIYSNGLCEQRARYELKKNYMRNTSISFNSIYVPHMEINDIVKWSFNDYGYYNRNFIVDSISIPLDGKQRVSITLTNVEELPLV